MKTSSAKAKGRNLQKWVRDQILKHSPSLEPDDVRSTSMGVTGVDVQLSSAAKRIWPFGVECKNQEAVGPVYSLYEQTINNAVGAGLIPLLVIKKNHKRPLIVMDAEIFFNAHNRVQRYER